MVILFHSLICMQLAKTTLILKQMEYILSSYSIWDFYLDLLVMGKMKEKIKCIFYLIL